MRCRLLLLGVHRRPIFAASGHLRCDKEIILITSVHRRHRLCLQDRHAQLKAFRHPRECAPLRRIVLVVLRGADPGVMQGLHLTATDFLFREEVHPQLERPLSMARPWLVSDWAI